MPLISLISNKEMEHTGTARAKAENNLMVHHGYKFIKPQPAFGAPLEDIKAFSSNGPDGMQCEI